MARRSASSCAQAARADATAHPPVQEVTHRLLFRAASARAGRPIQRQARHASRYAAGVRCCLCRLRVAHRLFPAQINILDMRGLNVGALTGKAMELTSKIAKIDQDNYPETLEACYIINPPWCETHFDAGVYNAALTRYIRQGFLCCVWSGDAVPGRKDAQEGASDGQRR
jgi:hypothetical protein